MFLLTEQIRDTAHLSRSPLRSRLQREEQPGPHMSTRPVKAEICGRPETIILQLWGGILALFVRHKSLLGGVTEKLSSRVLLTGLGAQRQRPKI